MMQTSKVMIVDDHRVVIEGIKGVLQDLPEFEMVGDAVHGRQALKRIETLKPDIVIMDISMPNLNGLDTTLQLKKLFPNLKIVVYSMHSESEYVIGFFKAGVAGYVLKDSPLSELVLALKAVRQKGTYFSASTQVILQRHLKSLETGLKKDAFERLSLREREVLQLLAEGKSIKEIAVQLYVSPKTVETHKYNMMAKLDTKRLADLIKIAIRKKLITI